MQTTSTSPNASAAKTCGELCADFYGNPTPAGAIRLAIADAHIDGHGTPEFFHQLNVAVRQLEERGLCDPAAVTREGVIARMNAAQQPVTA